MELLCLGDIGLIDKRLSSKVWPYPIKTIPEKETRILFNWELPVGEQLNPAPRSQGAKRFIAFPGSPEIIHGWAPGFVALATNHILDAGEKGLVDTIGIFTRMDFIPTGAGLSPNEITRPLIWETREGRLAIVNWVFPETHPDWQAVPGPHCWPGIDEAQRAISDLKKKNDWVIAFAHWSDELFPYPRPQDRIIAQKLGAAGLDILIGNHPHVVRGLEIFGICPVFYSIGNFFFSNDSEDRISKWAPRNQEALGVLISFKMGAKPDYTVLSFWQTSDQTIEDSRGRAVRRMNKTSVPLKYFFNVEYEKWYATRRRLFDILGAKWHFGIRKLGIKGLCLYALRKLSAIFTGK